MNQNQTVDNDLQKAIDNITNTTNVDPVFSDPVAAPSSVPEDDTGELGEPVGPFPEPKVEVVAPAPEPVAPVAPVAPAVAPDLTAMPDYSAAAPATMPTQFETTPEITTLNMHQVKEAALRDLVPLLDKLTIDPSQKFNLYRDIFESLRDYTVLEPAYKSAKEIVDDTTRANALLYLVEAIDKM